ncbi:MAG: mechanosensitive ion channel family protein [Planctomycetota bacterium]|nr:MAG: mechanosensitive ion channel family protein [Planctomycetota bacterium]
MSKILPWILLIALGLSASLHSQGDSSEASTEGQGATAAAPEKPSSEFAKLGELSSQLGIKDLWSKSKTAKDPEIKEAELKSQLRPLTKDEVKAELEAWQALVKLKATQRAEKESEVRQLEAGEARKQANSRVVELGTIIGNLADRMRIVIKAFRTVGGEVEGYEQYVNKVSSDGIPDIGASDNVFDIGAALYAWLVDPNGGIKWGLRILSFLAVLIAFKILAAFAAGLVRRAMGKVKKGSDLMRSFFVNTTRRLIFLIGLVIAVSQLGVDMTPVLAAIGATGFIVGFALQGTLSNFAAGLMILIYRPFDVGDAVDVAGVSGAVEKLTLVSTTIKSWDNKQIIVPNNSIWGNVITNITGNPVRRVDMVFGIGYSDDTEKAQKVLEEIIAAHPLVLKTPEPTIKLHELADSSVNFVVRPWAKTSDYWALYWDITRSVKERFDAEGLSIPFPQRDVHLFYENALPTPQAS